MADLILITGGARSGKSRLAVAMAETIGNRKVFVATCPLIDEEMAARIEQHKKERDRRNWDTLEEPTNIAGTLSRTSTYDVRVVDCLTLWVNNLMYQAATQDCAVNEDFISARCREIVEVCEGLTGTVIFVTNEVGSGIVPENALARRFRDVVGCCNRLIAEAAHQVVLTVCGLPLYLKKGAQS